MPEASERAKLKLPTLQAVMDAVKMLLLFEASQGLTLLKLPQFFFSARQLQTHAWIGVYEGHIWELAFALGFIAVVGKGQFANWGLNLRNAALSWQILWKFCLVFALITLAVDVAPPLLQHDLDLGVFGPPTPLNIAGWLTFEWIFVGIAEEIMFRGAIHTYLTESWPGVLQIRGLAIPTAGIVTTLLFCLAHINPLHPQIYWPQQLFAFGLGIYYSVVYHRTGSLLNPILAHNCADGLIVTAIYLVYFKLH